MYFLLFLIGTCESPIKVSLFYLIFKNILLIFLAKRSNRTGTFDRDEEEEKQQEKEKERIDVIRIIGSEAELE